jgi:diamine N-acetyltransferase
MTITLREINQDTVGNVCDLAVDSSQSDFVAPNAISLAQALFTPEAWYRAIYEDETLVGFIMLFDETLSEKIPESPSMDIWRFMIDKKFQGKGYGRAVLELVINLVRDQNKTSTLKLSYVPGNDSAVKLYESVGFVATGEVEEGEVIMKKSL